MIINSLPYRTSWNGVSLSRENRAPVGFARGARVYVRKTFEDDAGTDCILSPFHSSLWSDIWRVEVQIYDRRGQLAQILEAFDRYGIRVLASETRKAADEKYGVNHFMVWTGRYASNVDGTLHSRQSSPNTSLHGLQGYLLGHFLDELRLSSKVVTRLHIERNWAHYDLWERYGRNHQEDNAAADPSHDAVAEIGPGGWLQLEPDLLPTPANKPRIVYVSTNARSRLVYVAQRQESANIYTSAIIQFLGSDVVFGAILRELDNQRLNIVRSQLRPGCFGQPNNEVLLNRRDSFTFNVLLDGAIHFGEDPEDRCHRLQSILQAAVGGATISVRSTEIPTIEPNKKLVLPGPPTAPEEPVWPGEDTIDNLNRDVVLAQLARGISRTDELLKDETGQPSSDEPGSDEPVADPPQGNTDGGEPDTRLDTLRKEAMRTARRVLSQKPPPPDRPLPVTGSFRLFLSLAMDYQLVPTNDGSNRSFTPGTAGIGLAEIASQVCEEYSIEMVTGLDLGNRDDLVLNIADGINRSDMYLALLTPPQSSSPLDISPWLYFEFGLAYAARQRRQAIRSAEGGHTASLPAISYIAHERVVRVDGKLKGFVEQYRGHHCQFDGEFDNRIRDLLRERVVGLYQHVLRELEIAETR